MAHFSYENSPCPNGANAADRARKASRSCLSVWPQKLKKIAQLVDRSTVLRQLIDLGLESGQVLLLLRQPGIKGRTAVERVLRVVAADERVKITHAAVMRAPSVETQANALRAEEEQAEAMAAIHHHLKRPRSP